MMKNFLHHGGVRILSKFPIQIMYSPKESEYVEFKLIIILNAKL